jgi:hypothetical protein
VIIRAKQIDTLRAAGQRGFEDKMLVHLAGFSPPLFKATGEAQMREAIRLGMSKAEEYGFDTRGPVQFYLEMMLLFGSHFATDPQYAWSAEILNNREVGAQMERAEMLYERTMHYRENVAGPKDEFTLQALRGIRVWADQPLPLSRENFIPSMLQEINRIYPQKADYVGQDALEALIHEGGREALKHHFSMERGVTLVVVLMLAFGHGCASDPLYPWIARTLNDEAITDPAARAKRLETKALTWLDHVLAYFEERERA